MPQHVLVQWGSVRITDLPPSRLFAELGVDADFCQPLLDPLGEGPHHPDPRLQPLLRTAFFRTDRSDLLEAEMLLARIEAGEHLVLWGTRALASCLALL